MKKVYLKVFTYLAFLSGLSQALSAQTLAFPEAEGFGRYALGARGAAAQEVYIVTNLNDSGPGSFRDAVSVSGRIVVFAVGGIVRLASDVVVKSNITIAGQTAPGNGIVFFNKRVTFTSASNTICRYLRIRLGATGNSGNDATGLASGANMIFDHLSVTWGMDENFSLNNDGKGTPIDNITIQNSIIGQGLFRENHSAGGLIQTPDGGRVSLLKNLYMSNKTRNPKVKGVNEFVNNVVYNYGNGGRLDQDFTYPWAGDAYIMGGSSGTSEVNVINNYFVGGPLTPASKTTPFSRGTGTFNIYGAGNYFDNNKDGMLNGAEVPFDENGYPGITGDAFKTAPYPYPLATPAMTATQSYQYIIDNVGSNYPRRDEVDNLMINEVASKGTLGMYVYRETDLPLSNGGLGNVYNAPAPLDSDADGMPDAWEDANGLNKNDKTDAVKKTLSTAYLNIEVYINSLPASTPPAFVVPPSNVTLSGTSAEIPAPKSTVVVKWQDGSSNEDNFVLERSANGISFTDIAHPAANATTYTDSTGLLPNTTYYYRIKAVAGSEASVYSTVTSLKTPALPAAPSQATIGAPTNGAQYVELITGGKTTLKWTGSTNTTGYAVYFGTDPAALVKQADKAYTASPSHEVSGLTENTTYYWRIDASNAKGSADGNVWSFRTTKTIPKGMVGYWSFDESGDDTHVVDSSAYENNGVLGLEADDASIRVSGKLRNALNFSTARVDRYVVSVPHQDQLYFDKGSFSVSFWMKATADKLPQDNNSSAYLLCKGSITKNTTTGATGRRFDVEFKNKQIRFAIDDDVTKYEAQATATSLFNNTWVHVVVLRDTSIKRLRIYANGTLLNSTTIANTTIGTGEASALVIGNIGELEFLTSTNAPAPYKGQLDELKIFNYGLSDAEIAALGTIVPPSTLPLKLNSFTAAKTENGVLVKWQTAEEVNTKDFAVQRSSDGINYQTISTVAANGRSINSYAFTDAAPLNGANYYRLLMSDIDGRNTYSPVRSILFDKQVSFVAAPNPASDRVVLSFTATGEDALLEVSDMNGRLLKTISFSSNVTTYTLPTTGLPNGTYLVRLRSKAGTGVQKLVVRH